MGFLVGDQIELSPLDPEDDTHSTVYARSRNDPTMRATGAYGQALTQGQACDQLEELQNSDDPTALCAMQVDDEVVGWAGTHLPDVRARVAHVGYYVLPGYQGQGYASEAAQLLVAYAFDELNAHSIRAEVQADNPASERVLEKLGFQQEGRKRAAYYKEGEYKDLTIWSVFEDEFDQ
jgi:RimJ/RimL family protein N-acetyltransferase